MERMEEYQRMREEEAGRPVPAELACLEKRTGPGGCVPVSGPGDRHGLGHGRFRRAGPAAGGKRGTVDPLLSGGGRDGPPGGRDGGDPGRHLYQPQLYRGLPADRPKRRRGGGNASLLLEADPGRGGPEGVPLLLLCGAQPEWAGSGRKPRLGGSVGGREAGEHLSGLYHQRGGGHESGGRPQAPSLLSRRRRCWRSGWSGYRGTGRSGR